MKWDESLSDEQKDAAGHSGSHARLLAGPGTGKTLTLTRRITRLLSSDIRPASILAFTFTRFAAGELKKRVKDDLGTGKKVLPRISTLHSYALRELLRNESRTRLPQPLRIADDWEDENIVIPDIQNLLGIKKSETRKLFFQLAADWQQLTADRQDWERTFPDPKFLGSWKEHRGIYGYTLRSELVYQLKTSLEEGDVEIEGPPEYVLVDEFQDLNPCDLAVVREHANLGCEIYAAGDDDQSIYGFRQAEPEGIRRFPSDFTPSTQLGLKICKRCRKEILDFALYVARQDPRRLEKPLIPESKEKGEVKVLRFDDQGREALGIGQLCQWLVKNKKVRPQDILILLRTDRNKVFSTPLKAALVGAGVPANVASNPMEPLETDIGRELLSLLRLMVNLHDDLAWRSILQVRNNGLGTTTFEGVYETARRSGMRFSAGLDGIVRDPSSLGAKGGKLKSEVEEIQRKIKAYGPVPEKDVFSWLENLIEKEITDDESRNSILELFGEIESDSDVRSLADLLRAATVSLGNKEQDLREGAVSVLTMHQAKGLTASAVIVAAAEDEYIPGRATGKQVDDERRLLYVSLTRAKEFLYVTYCRNRTGQQRYSGRTSGQTARRLTQFLSGGPIAPVPGESFTSKLK
jgi:DNA helicase-2/ATP-dependent DNA helicase PcrA